MRFAIVGLFAIACSSREPTRVETIDVAMQRGAAFLVARQQPDGGWYSKTYAALRDGWSVSPLVTLALKMCPQDGSVAGAYRRGVAFVAGLAGRKPPEVGYPLHAYAIGALVLGAPDNKPRYAREHAALIAALRGLQLNPANGWSEGDLSYGGWGYAWDARKAPDAASGETPTANLSASVLAIGALVFSGVSVDDPALIDARRFVERCQRSDDGGFVFSLEELGANKAGVDPSGPRSYGSMTADGVRALIRLARPLNDRKVELASGWLDKHFDATRNPGAFPPGDEVRRASSYYYWLWTAAHAARHLNKRAWAEAIVDALLREQQIDGSWRNAATEMREDDPLVATPFALAALGLARSLIAAEPRSHAY